MVVPMADKLEPCRYQLVIKIPYDAIDNLQARQIAKEYLDTSTRPTGSTVKLQRIQDNKEPIGVPL